MTLLRPHIVGIAGTTCSGKSRLARYLKEITPENRPVIISSDSYYRDLSALSPEEREDWNFDAPEAIEAELLCHHLDTLASGNKILCPVYDFATHTRSTTSIRVTPGDLIIVEGLFVLYWEEIRQLLNTKVFVLLTETASLARRLERDVRERGRTRQSVLNQYNRTVKPMTEKYVLPTSAFADILVNGEDPIEQSSAEIISLIQLVEVTPSTQRMKPIPNHLGPEGFHTSTSGELLGSSLF